ncbi:MAG TPA: MlaD family protein [Thermoanaerobaculia bacterium]|jgi:phospholipid/cholesterol/gamma-HCH transport system substrate-binding protein|nr:MlaD family protein [Thermoanaerobaculia bacterium]
MSTAAKVGAFFLVVLAITALFIWKIEELRIGRGVARKISVQFKDVGGLDEKSAVRVAGVRVGRVTKIRLVEGKALVDIELDRDVALRQGASASIESLGLLGEKYVELVPGPFGAPPLPDNAVILGGVPVSFDEITKLARDIEVDIKEITRSLKESIGGAQGEERLVNIVENMRVISEQVRSMVEANRAGVDATVANFREFSSAMSELVARVDSLVTANQGNVTEGLSNVREISEKLDTTADNLNQITNRIREGEGTVGKLVQSEETHKNLNDALVAVREGVAGLNKALGAIGRTKIDLGLRAEHLAAHGKGKGYFTLDINPPDTPRFYRVELVTQPFGRRKSSTTVERTVFPDGHTEQTITDTDEFKDDFAISALFGYRWKDLVARGGLVESRGGGGIDYLLLKDRLRFSAELWDFNRPGDFSAHAKLSGRYYFSPSVFVTGGWDDFLNRKRDADSIFFGAGLRWRDEDIKYLLGSIPIRR